MSLRSRTGRTAAALGNLVRRLAVASTTGTRWGLTGATDGEGNVDTDDAEAFTGYVYGRPAGAAEAVVVNTSAQAGAPVIVAHRDGPALRAALAGASLAAGDAMVFNGAAVVVLRADGTIELRSHGGTAVPLATKADVDALRTYVYNQFSGSNGHIHVVAGAATTTMITVPTAASPPTPVLPPVAAGTQKVRGE